MGLTYCKVISCRKRFTAPILTPNLFGPSQTARNRGGRSCAWNCAARLILVHRKSRLQVPTAAIAKELRRLIWSNLSESFCVLDELALRRGVDRRVLTIDIVGSVWRADNLPFFVIKT